MTLKLQKEVPSLLIITALLCIFAYVAGKKIQEQCDKDPYATPKGIAFAAIWLVEWIDGMVANTMGKKRVEEYGPIVGTIALYLVVANLSGLFGFNTPTMNLSVTLAVAGVTWFLIQRASIKTNGIGAYMHAFIEPFPFMVLGNFISKFTPLISMSMRLFGNLLSGSVLMSLVYMACGNLSAMLFGNIGADLNFVGMVVAPLLHAYFDVFSGCIQMYIFISLTMAFVGNELGD